MFPYVLFSSLETVCRPDDGHSHLCLQSLHQQFPQSLYHCFGANAAPRQVGAVLATLLLVTAVSDLLGELRRPLPPFCPESPPAPLPELISPFCDERMRDTATGPACSCNVTFHSRMSALVGVSQRSLPPFCPEFPPAPLPESISTFRDEWTRDTATGSACSCNVTFRSHMSALVVMSQQSLPPLLPPASPAGYR